MEQRDSFEKVIQKWIENSSDQSIIAELTTAFWSNLINSIESLIKDKQPPLDQYLQQNYDLLNYGICKEVFTDTSSARKIIEDGDFKKCRLQIDNFTTWLKDLVQKINQGDKKDFLLRESKLAKIQINKLKTEIKLLQQERKNRLSKSLQDGNRQNSSFLKQVETLNDYDNLLLESIRTRKAIAKGTFFSVEQRREHCTREKQLQKDKARLEVLINLVHDRESSSEIKKIMTHIEESITHLLEQEESLAKLESDLGQLNQEVKDLSPIEIAYKVRKEIEYLRDLIKLSSKRSHAENRSILSSTDKPITIAHLTEAIDRVIEFDPNIFKNDRINILGQPQILLIPGSGNTVYDWKNNKLIVPLIPISGNYMASIATGFIEYRLDADEEKKLITSYNSIPEMKTIKSIIQLRQNLMKDYIIWMTSEYSGYRILAKNTKEWFEREIAPDRNNIFTPMEYQSYRLSSDEYKKLFSEVESNLYLGLDRSSEKDLWVGSILYYQQGRYDKSYELLTALMKREPTDTFVLFNLGQTGMKLMRKNESIQAFTDYCAKNPQGWWSKIARDQIRKLQA